MAYLVSNDTAQWIKAQRANGTLSQRQRRYLPCAGGGGKSSEIAVCIITGGTPLTGYTARAYPTMKALRADSGGTAGTSTTIYPVEIGLNASLPAGTVVLCHSVICRVTGGTENTQS